MSQQQAAEALPVREEVAAPFISTSHRIGYETLLRAYRKRQAFAVLVGEGHTGASFVINRFVAALEADTTVVRITDASNDALGSMQRIIRGIGFDPKDLGLEDLDNILAMYLSFQKAHHRRTVICLEDAQENSRFALDRLRRLVEVEERDRNGFMLVCSGPPAFKAALSAPPLDAIRSLAGRPITLAPFTQDETLEYIRRRVEAARRIEISDLFEFDAICLLHELSAGVPDTVIKLCTSCMDLLDEHTVPLVTPDVVRMAGKRLRQAMDADDTAAGRRTPTVNGLNPPCSQLIVRKDGEIIHVHEIERGHILIGRNEMCDIRLADPAVSQHHALIINSSKGIRLLDLGSTNGTFVNEHPVTQHELCDGDDILVGSCAIEYVAGSLREAWLGDPAATDRFILQFGSLAAHSLKS